MTKNTLLIALFTLITIFHPPLEAKKKFYVPNDDDVQLVEKLYKEKKYSEAFPIYQKLAKAGDKYAQYKLSLMYLLGQGADVNFEKSYSWAFVAKESKEKHVVALFNKLDKAMLDENRSQYEDSAINLYMRYNDLEVSERALKALKKEFPNCTGSRLKSIGACRNIRVMCKGYFGDGGAQRYLFMPDSCEDFLVKIHPDNLKALKNVIHKMELRIQELKMKRGVVAIKRKS
ncbi:hypothetical protein [Kangiella sp. TOML190]|uniref:hypothetical protein n=1 Tax=Kangiella sp. TOML190 TaxID=2931351 RepID=UPI00203CDB1F|nr:hypothetical protein [Kangiella sp. TOML190]